MSTVMINTKMSTQPLYEGGTGPWPSHGPGRRTCNSTFALVSSEMILLQGPPTVAIETSWLETAVSLGGGEISVHVRP